MYLQQLWSLLSCCGITDYGYFLLGCISKMSMFIWENASSEYSASSCISLSLWDHLCSVDWWYMFTREGRILNMRRVVCSKIWAFKPLPKMTGGGEKRIVIMYGATLWTYEISQNINVQLLLSSLGMFICMEAGKRCLIYTWIQSPQKLEAFFSHD